MSILKSYLQPKGSHWNVKFEKETWSPLCSTQPVMAWNVECGMWNVG
jgi:hypothetical protein